MSESIKICAVGIVCALACVLVRNLRTEFLIPIRLASILLSFGIILILINPIFEYLKNIFDQTLPIEYMEILIKALCIAYITQISGEICRECGENSIAFGVESAGRIEIMILSIPLINKVIDLSKELVAW